MPPTTSEKSVVPVNALPGPRENMPSIVSNILNANDYVGVEGHPDKVVEYYPPDVLKKKLNLLVEEKGLNSQKDVEDIFHTLIKYSVRTKHPHFYNQLFGGVDEIGLAGAWLIEALNTNQYTYEVAPALVIIEHYLVNFLVSLFGWTDGDGIFNPGGSMSNLYGLSLARHKKHPELKKTGLFNTKPLVVFTSDHSHYSIKKSACVMGIGLDNVVLVKSDKHGLMIPEDLSKEIQKSKSEGKEPYFVNATSGSTVLGSYDPIRALAGICKQEKMWLHVDACWGGSVIFSKKHKHLLDGIDLVDSISWNPHKMIAAPLQCSVFLVKHKNLLHETNCSGANYLFQQDKFYDISYDTGDKSIQCGRKPDAVKFWIMLKVHGLNHFERQVDQVFDLARFLENELKKREGFELVLEKSACTNVCFWYIPPSLRNLKRDDAWWDKISKVAPAIKEKIVKRGSLMLGYQPMHCKGFVNFFRMVITTAPERTTDDMKYVVDEIENCGKDLKF